MHPIHTVDPLLLLALAMASKRRPAELIEIIAAIDLTQTVVPSELRLIEAFSRLATHGLIREIDGGFALTPNAEVLLTGQPKTADTEQRLQSIKDKLAAYTPTGEHPPIVLTAKTVCTAILEQRVTAKMAGKNLLVPKPANAATPRPGQRQRKPLAARRRKD